MSSTTTTHLAAILPSKGSPLSVQPLPTPKPGPGEVLVAVKSVALNPVDAYIRNLGFFVTSYPTVLGSDISGVIVDAADDVPPHLQQPGTPVAAFASGFFKGFNPVYGAFQEKVLVAWQGVCPLPTTTEGGGGGDGNNNNNEKKSSIPWNEAATLPMSVEVPLSTWDILGIPLFDVDVDVDVDGGEKAAATTKTTKTNKKDQALLIWGASSSVGTMGVQSAKLLKQNSNNPFAKIYATSGPRNSEYVKKLGADRVFDYKDPQVVGKIIEAAKAERLVIKNCYLAAGQLAPCQGVLKGFLSSLSSEGEEIKGKIGSAPIIPQDAEVIEGLETFFVQSSHDPAERSGQFARWMGGWLKGNLEKGLIRPSPEVTVVGKGLEAVNGGLDKLLGGVSCTKLVIEVEE